MISKTKVLVIALFVLFISLGAVCAQDNITADDINAIDDAGDVETPILGQDETADEVVSEGEVGDFGELSRLISTSSSGSEINLTKDYKHVSGDGVYSGGITIDKKLTIDGKGHTIDASGLGRIFRVTGSNVVLKNINFINGYSSYDVGVGVYASGYNFKIINSTFENNVAYGASALYLTGDYSNVIGCKFIGNKATYEKAAALFLQGNFGNIINSTFDHNIGETRVNEPYQDGGAVYIFGVGTTIDGCNFTNNIQTWKGGGALYCGGFYGDLKNCNFINNSAPNAYGGGASILGFYWDVFNTVFENNTAATYGGGLFFNAQNGVLYNLTFNNNSAHMGGGAYLAYDTAHNTYVQSAASSLRDSVFTNNHAVYGGGAIDAISRFKIDNCDFINNTAGNYGGAVSIGYSTLTNSRFRDNKASFGGAVFSYASEISNSNFTDNQADHVNSIYSASHSELKNNTGDDDANNNPSTQGAEITGSHEVVHMLETKNGYYGFCSELYNCNPYTGVFDDSIDLIKNAINGQPVKEYLKILIYRFLDNFDDLKQVGFHNYVWAFTDREYWNSDDPVVKNVIELYNSGFRVPSVNACKVLANGTLMYINFSSMITPSSQQNLFLFKFAYGEPINQIFTKEALINRTVYVGESVEYRLVINNKGTAPVYDNWVEDKEHSDGLIYESWRAEVGNWTYNEQMHQWHLDVLEPGTSASIILTFGVTLEGLLVNNAVSGLGDVNVTKSGAGFESHNPNMTVEKKTVTPQVEVGNLTMFDIIVWNTGDVDLDNVFVCESEYDSGLVYLDFISREGAWKHSLSKEGKHVFTLTEPLEIDSSASFRVIFNTTKSGNLSNTVTAGYNDTTMANSTNVTEVINNTVPETPDNNTNTTNETNETTNETNITISASISADIQAHGFGEVPDVNDTDDDKKAVDKPDMDEKATGNPLLILLAALMFLPLRRFKK